MRLSLALPILAGLLLGWAAAAQADAPPAAPIFYCPTPGKADPAATPTKPGAHTGLVVHASAHRHHGCPTQRIAGEHHRWHGHGGPAKAVASNDVSASQAFIYRYERAVHGLDARAAEEAWAEGRHPPCPHGPADHCPGHWGHDAWRHDGPLMGGPPMGGPPMGGPQIEGPALAERESLPPPCPHRCPGPDAWRHAGPPDGHEFAERAPVPPVDARPLPPPAPEPAPPPPPSVHVDAWQDGHSGYRYDEREQQSERAGGWSYRESDGRGHYQHWGDHFAGEPGWDGDHHWSEGPRRCPPPVPANACAASQDPAQDPAPRHADVAVAGRDAAGYLTWPGKTEQ